MIGSASIHSWGRPERWHYRWAFKGCTLHPEPRPGTCGGRRLGVGAVYVIATKTATPGPREVDTRGGSRLTRTPQPVGIQHAVARIVRVATPPRALCGADIGGWVMFGEDFIPACTASCQRCSQLVTSAVAERRHG